MLPLAFWSGACTQNVTCVFAGSCDGGPGPISDNEASLPVDGEWVVDGVPRVDAFSPSGTTNPGTTPVVLVFSESMQEASLLNAVEIITLVGGLGGNPVAGVVPSLVCDGRVLLLLPSQALVEGDYIVRLSDQAVVLDLTGQVLDEAPGAQLGAFSVSATPPTVPRLVTTFPANNAQNQSETSQILAVFDRPVLANTVTATSFDVRVNGSDPTFDPLADPVRLGSTAVPDTRAFLYRSVDGDGVPAALGTDLDVQLRLSPAGSPISEQDGGVLAAQTITFHTLPFAAVRSALLMSVPHDAIGLANLTPGDPEELLVVADLVGANPNDNIDLFLFGEQRGTTPNQPLIALQRTLRLTGTAPIVSASFTRADVALQFSSDPANVRFNDGPVTFAFRARRGTTVGPLRILDLEPDPLVIQDPLLDTTRPGITSLGGTSGTDAFRSDLRGLSLAGKAGERLESAEVDTPLGNNAAQPAVVGSTDGGDFLASPVNLDVVAGGTTTYSLLGRDAARNASSAVTGTFTQVGVLGSGAHVPGNLLEVEVFDSRTLLPLAGARVLIHSDLGDGLNFPFERSALTGVDGRLQIATNGAPSLATIVTVVNSGYDLFTLHGVPSAHVSVPLRASGLLPAQASGQASTTNPGAVAFLNGLDIRYDDSRRAVEEPRGFAGPMCSGTVAPVTCLYGSEPIGDARFGARSVYAGNFLQMEGSFQASQVLRVFSLVLPLAPVAANRPQAAELTIDTLLDDPSAPPADVAQALPAFTFRVDPGSGVDLNSLAADPATTGDPFVTVEVLVPGLTGSIAVSQGVAFEQGGDRWTVRTAQPGAITPSGSLGSQGGVDTDPFVRVEVVDTDGNAAGARPRLSSILAAGASPEFQALAAPLLLSPAAAASSGGQAFLLLLEHAIGDDRSEGGLYRVELRDPNGRGWTLWRFDPPGSAPVELRVVDVLTDGGVVGLADGNIDSLATAWAWSGLVPTDFLWTDVEREFELFSRAAQVTFSKP